MDLEFHGANCCTMSTKNARITIDDNLADLGAKSVSKPGDIALFTMAHPDPVAPAKLLIDQPGEYEVAGISIVGIPARAHIDESDEKTTTMYKVTIEDLKLLVVGHVYPALSESQLDAIGLVDVMFVPVGGHGYTLDPAGALAVIKKVEPKIVIPTHYADASLNFPVPQTSLDEALRGLGIEQKETLSKLKLKSADLADTLQLIVLERS